MKIVTRQPPRKNIGDVINAVAVCFHRQPKPYRRYGDISGHKLLNTLRNTNTTAVAGSSDRQLNKSGTDLLLNADTLITVRGRVVDEKGEPLNGVTVTVKETSKATSTDENGYFTIMVRKGDVLEFSYVGHEAVELKVKDKSVFITLKPSVSKLEEVEVTVNTGYQDIPKERATGSFVKVDKELFNRRVSTDVLDRIEGIARGVFFNGET